MTRGARVVVAMSGGVDSSLAAALLKEQGYEVIGMMLRLWSEKGKEDSNRCCTPESMGLARRAAAKLDVPFYAIDAKEPFRSTVVESFLQGYARGETPNPCLECNRTIRWKVLLEHALAMGTEFMATGHYARVSRGPNGAVTLRRALDTHKDQSYVLHVLTQAQLQHALFPIGDYLKSDVRRMAEERGLPSATRHDSQDLCFLAGEDYRGFLRRNRPGMLTPGEIVDRAGTVLGRHEGLANYTIGQRKGIGVQSGAALYVLGKNVATNRLVVGLEKDLGRDSLTADRVNWVGGEVREGSFRASVKTRYTALEQPATIVPLEEGRRVQVHFDARQRDITAGQAAVFYEEDAVVGGGIIE